MIGHLDQQQKNKKGINVSDSLLKDNSVYAGFLQNSFDENFQDSSLKKEKKESPILSNREKLYNDYSDAVREYINAEKNKPESRGQVQRDEILTGITLDQAIEYLMFLDKFDISSDEALVGNYKVLADAEKIMKKMQSIPDLLNSSLISPDMKIRYERLRLISEYAACRFSCIENALFTKLSDEDLSFIANAPDIEAVLARNMLDKKNTGPAGEEDLKKLFKDIKRANEIRSKIKGEDPFGDNSDGFLDEKFDEELNSSFLQSDDSLKDEVDLENMVASLEDEQEVPAEEKIFVSRPLDKQYVTRHFPYAELLNNKRKNNKEDGAKMKEIKKYLGRLYYYTAQGTCDATRLDGEYDELIRSLEDYVSSHDVFYMTFTQESSTRLRLVKEALKRARTEREYLHKLYPVFDKSNLSDWKNVEVKGDSRELVPLMAMGAGIAMAVSKSISEICEDKKRSKNRTSVLAGLFYQEHVLNMEDPDRYCLLGGSDGVAAELVGQYADESMLSDFYAEKDRMLIKLVSRYNAYRRHPVPKAFLKDKNADPSDAALRDNYALLRIMHDDAYRQLAGLNLMEEHMRGINSDVLDKYKARREKDYKKNELGFIGKGKELFNDLDALSQVSINNLAGHFPGIDAGQVVLMHFEEGNEVKKAMKKYGLKAAYTGEETSEEVREKFAQKFPQYADLQRYDQTTAGVFEEETRMKIGDEKTNRRYARSGIAPGSAMKKRSLMTGVMANLLGMGNLVAQDTYGEKQVGDKVVRGVYKQAPLGISLVENSAYELDSNAKAQMAKLVFLNIICGQMDLDSAMLTGEKKVLSNGSNGYVIKNIRLEKYTEFSFGTLTGKELIEAYKKGQHAGLLGKLDDATKKAIRDLNPLFLEHQFGAYLSKEEMAALKNRVSEVQRFLEQPYEQETKKNDTYEPERSYVPKGEELTFEKVMDYVSLPEKEREKRRVYNNEAYKSAAIKLKINAASSAERFKKRLSEETGLTPDEITRITAGHVRYGKLVVNDGFVGNRMYASLRGFLNQEMVSDEDFYLILKGFYSESLRPYTHQDEEAAKASFDLAVSKYKDFATMRLERLMEKLGELPALLNPDDLYGMIDGVELKSLFAIVQDIAQMNDKTKGGRLFDKNNPRDAKLLELVEYGDAIVSIFDTYNNDSDEFEQDRDISDIYNNKNSEFKPAAVKDKDIAPNLKNHKNSMEIIISHARKYHKGPALSKEEYDLYTAGCKERLKNRPLALKYQELRKEVLRDHSFVKKEKGTPDDSDYEARVEELRKQKNTSVTVEGLKLRDKFLKEDMDKLREVNEFLAEHNINASEYTKAFDSRSPRIFLESYERDENGNPKDAMAKRLHKQNRDFLAALFTGDKNRMRPHLDRAVGKVLSYDITMEHLKDRNWMMRHPEIFQYINYYTYFIDCILKNEEYAWYFEELPTQLSAMILSRAAYITELSKVIGPCYLNGVLGFNCLTSEMKLYKDLSAEENCKTEEEAWNEYQQALEELQRLTKKDKATWPVDFENIWYLNNKKYIQDYCDKIRNDRNENKSDPNRMNKLQRFYDKHAASITGDRVLESSDSVTMLVEKTFSDVIKYDTASGTDVKIEDVKSSIGQRTDRSDKRITMLLEDREQKRMFDEVCALLPNEVHEMAKSELKHFYSFFLSNLVHLDKEAAADNLGSVLKKYYADEAGRQKAMDFMTLDLVRVAQDRSAFEDKMLKGAKGFAMKEMAKDYAALLKKNPVYVNYLKNKTDPATGKNYAELVGNALDIIRACGYYARIYNLLAMDPVYASSDSAFLSSPASPYDTAHVSRVKATMVILNNLAEQIKAGGYKKIRIDDAAELEKEDKMMDDFCSKFREAAGKEQEAVQDITQGLKERIDEKQTADEKVLELSRLLTSLSTMHDTFGWGEQDLGPEISRIINENPEVLKAAAVSLREKMYKDLEKDYKRFLSGEVPEYLKDPGYKGDKNEQKKSAAMLMLTTTTPFRRLRGVEKLLNIIGERSLQEGEIFLVYHEALMRSGSDQVYPGLSQKGIMQVQDMAGRVDLRVAKAHLAKYTASENVGYTERNPITKEEIEGWFKKLPEQEENSRNQKPVSVDETLLQKAKEKLPQLHEEFSDSITEEGVILLEQRKKDVRDNLEANTGFKDKMLKDVNNTYGIDSRDYLYYDIVDDGSSMEILFSDEPEVREIYMDKYVRKLMNLEISLDKTNVNWAMGHLNEFSYIMNLGIYAQNMIEDNPEYFKKFPREFLNLFNAKAEMVGTFASCIQDELRKIGVSYGHGSYFNRDEMYAQSVDREMDDSNTRSQHEAYYKARHRMLWICRNAGNKELQGEDKYTELSADINAAAYKNKPLTLEDYKKPDKAAMKQRRSSNTLSSMNANITRAQSEVNRLKREAAALIPSELDDYLTMQDSELLKSLYPLIVDYYVNDKDIAKEEFKNLCRLFAGAEDGHVSAEVAALQKKAALDMIAEYIMSYKIKDPAMVETDEDMTSDDNVKQLEILTEAMTAFRSVISNNPDWMSEKNNRAAQGGKTEGELLRGNMKVLEALAKDYSDRKQAIRRANNGT